jgi:hypothetical protein
MADMYDTFEGMIGAPTRGGFRGDAANYQGAPNPVAVQMKSYTYLLWLPLISVTGRLVRVPAVGSGSSGVEEVGEILGDRIAELRGMIRDHPAETRVDNIVSRPYNRQMDEGMDLIRYANTQLTDNGALIEYVTGNQNHYLVETNRTLPNGKNIQLVDRFIQRPLLEADKAVMTPEQMRITLLTSMIPATDVNKWTLKSQMWPIIVKLAQGVLIEPRPEVLAAPCKWYSVMQLKKFLNSMGTEVNDTVVWREAYMSPAELCQTYAEMFANSITDASFANAVGRRANTESKQLIRDAESRGRAELMGYTDSKKRNSTLVGQAKRKLDRGETLNNAERSALSIHYNLSTRGQSNHRMLVQRRNRERARVALK